MKWISRTLVGAVSVAVVAGLSAAPSQALALRSATPSWHVNGRVYATAIVGDTLVVGGSFSVASSPNGVGVNRHNLAAFSLTTGAVIGTWRADTNSVVRALDADGSSIYAGGSFSTVAGVDRGRLVKLSASTGAVDTSFTGHTNQTVRAIETDGPSLFVGGTFTSVDGLGRNRIAKISAKTGALVTSFSASASGPVYALKMKPGVGVLYVGGAFAHLSGAARRGLGSISAASGATLRTSFADSPHPTLGLSTNGSGTRLYAAGGGRSNSALAWSTKTGRLLWSIKTDGDVQSVLYDAGTVYFGFHDGYRGNGRIKLLAARAVGGHLTSFRPLFTGFWGVYALAASPSTLVVAGEFSKVGGVRAGGFARFQTR